MPYDDNATYLLTELEDCLEILYEILINLEDIRIVLEKGRDPDFCHVPYFLGLSPSFSGLPASFPPVPDPFPVYSQPFPSVPPPSVVT